jgi:ribosomal protein S12 methylthiotransferase accessory factor
VPAGRGPHREGLSSDFHRPAERGRGESLARTLGVTRVARLTGLDRTGVEVASAVRPRGHVLQVTNGKGETAAEAAMGALLEAAELAGAETATVSAWGTTAELAARGQQAIGPRALDPGGGEDGWDEVRLAWARGRDLATGADVLVPAHAVHVPPPGGAWLGPALLRWTSNGMGASRDPAAALLHALLEAIERDRVARALPDGFTEREIGRRLVDPRSLARVAPRTVALAERIERVGIGVFLLDLSFDADLGPGPGPGTNGLGLPAAAAVLLDGEGSAVPVAAGYACRLRRDDALRAALLEAAQSRATEIQGAREDVAVSDRGAAEPLRALLERARARRPAAALPDVRARSPREAVREIVRRLGRAGLRAVAVPLAGPPGTTVERAIVPGLLLSELLG